MSPSPFGDYTGGSDSVVARLELSMPEDADAKVQNLSKAFEGLRTTVEANNRFTREFIEYCEKLPEIEQKIKDLHKAHADGLKESTEELGKASEAGDKFVAAPITRTPGAGAGQPHIPTVAPAPTAKAAHEHLTTEDLTKPPAHITQTHDSSPPPSSYPHGTGDRTPPPAPDYNFVHPSSPSATPSVSAPTPIRSTPYKLEIPHSEPAPPHVQHASAPIPGHVDHPSLPITPTHTSSPDSPVYRPPAPVPVSEHPLPSPQQPILPLHTEFGTSVPAPPTSPAIGLPHLSIPQTPVIPQSHSGLPHVRETSLPGRPAPLRGGQDAKTFSPPSAGHPSIPATHGEIPLPHHVDDLPDGHPLKRSIADHIESVGKPSPITGLDHIQTGRTASPFPTASPGGPPPRIEPHEGGPATHAAQNIVIRAGSVRVESGDAAQVHSGESHVHTPTNTTHTTPHTETETPRGSQPGGPPKQPPKPPPAPPTGQEPPPRPGVPTKPRPGTPQSQMDYRQKIGNELKGKPAEIFDRLHQRGMTSETTGIDGKKHYQVHLGDKSVPFEEFEHDEGLHEQALDALGHEASPQSAENAGPLKRAMHAGKMAADIGRTVRHGGDATKATGELGDLVSSMGKGGGLMEGVGGAIGGAARFAGPAGLAVGALTGINAAVQSGGEKVQGLYNEGTIRGGGTMAGAKIEGSVAAMALNPFITNEQSRQIIMGALNTGAQGGAYDNITSFMKDNLTGLNISVADSTKMLNKNVKEGGQSIESLGLQLGALKNMSTTGSQTFPQLQQNFQKTSGELINQGGTGPQASHAAMVRANMFNASNPDGSPNVLAGQASSVFSQLESNPAFQGELANRFAPGTNPRQAVGDITSSGQINQDEMQIMASYVQEAKQSGTNAPSALQEIMRAKGTNISIAQSREWINQVGTPEAAKAATEQANQGARDSVGNKTEKKGQFQSMGNWISSIGSGVQRDWDKAFGSNDDVAKDNATIQGQRSEYSNKALDSVTQTYGLDNTVAFDEQGKPHKIDTNDETQMKGLESGQWKVAGATNDKQKKLLSDDFDKGAAALKGQAGDLTDIASGIGADGSGAGQANQNGGQFGLTPQAAELLKLIPGGTANDPNTRNANAGSNGATVNNAQPGNEGTPGGVPRG